MIDLYQSSTGLVSAVIGGLLLDVELVAIRRLDALSRELPQLAAGIEDGTIHAADVPTVLRTIAKIVGRVDHDLPDRVLAAANAKGSTVASVCAAALAK